MKILVAPDKFKECLSAPEACELLAGAAAKLFPDATLIRLPLADGGDGFATTLTAALGGTGEDVPATGPYGGSLTGRIGWVDAKTIPAAALALLDIRAHGRVAILDSASVSGLALAPVDKRDPFRATSRGLGDLIARAAERGASAIIAGLGGVATNDLGVGALEKIGLELTDPEKGPLRASVPADWSKETRLGGYLWPNIPDLRLACDVTNPLLGPNGATYAFGPQKGLDPAGVNAMERIAGTMAKKLCDFCEKPRTLMAAPGAGAAGGLGFGLQCALDARIVPGAALIAACLDLENRIREADLIVTGEGRFDLSSLGGKIPGLVLALAAKHRKQVVVIAGRVAPGLDLSSAALPGKVRVVAASHEEWSLAQAREHAGEAFALALAEAVARL